MTRDKGQQYEVEFRALTLRLNQTGLNINRANAGFAMQACKETRQTRFPMTETL
jgi:hypothetical protein